MKLLDDRMELLNTVTGEYLKMGVVSDGLKRYIIFTSIETGKIYIEEIYVSLNASTNANLDIRLKKIDLAEEWKAIFKYITTQTTVLSEKRLTKIFGKNLPLTATSEKKNDRKK